jgi:hypothetical protein
MDFNKRRGNGLNAQQQISQRSRMSNLELKEVKCGISSIGRRIATKHATYVAFRVKNFD